MKAIHIFTAALLFIATTVAAQQKIEVSDLPSGATEFIKRHFPSASIRKVKTHRKRGEKGYFVLFTDRTELEFWKDGKWREVDGRKKPIPTEFIDTRIMDYVSKNYPNNKITHIDYSKNHIDVDLTGKIYLKFNRQMELLRVR